MATSCLQLWGGGGGGPTTYSGQFVSGGGGGGGGGADLPLVSACCIDLLHGFEGSLNINSRSALPLKVTQSFLRAAGFYSQPSQLCIKIRRIA